MQSVVLMTVDQKFRFPLYITMCSLLTTPDPVLPIPRLDVVLSDSSGCQTHGTVSRVEPHTPQTISPSDSTDTDVLSDTDCELTDSNTDLGCDQVLSHQAESLLAYLSRSKSKHHPLDQGGMSSS